MTLFGFGKSLQEPGNVGGVASRKFSGIGSRIAQIVAGALNVQGGISDATEGPPAIFDAGDTAADTEARRSRLHFLVEAMLPERERIAEKDGALVVEAFEGGESAIGGTVAVGPVVIAGREDRGSTQRIEISQSLRV